MPFPSRTGASGIWTLKDQRTYFLNESWPLTQSFVMSANVTTLYEGNAVFFGINTVAVANGEVLFWTIPPGTVTADDFVEGILEGTATVHRNNSNIILTATRVGAGGQPYEGPEPFYIELRLNSNVGDIVTVSPTVTIDELPGYIANANITAIAEGNAVVFTIDTTNIPDGTTLYWTNGGTTDGSDFIGGLNNGTFVVNGSTGNVTLTMENNAVYEGTESIIFQVRTAGLGGPVVATAPTVTVTDYPATYSITPNVSSITEGPNAVLFSIVTTNVPNGTTLYWTEEGTADTSDILPGVSGSLVVHNLTSNLTITSVFDEITEGVEYANIVLRTGSTSGPIVATATPVTIVDTSLTPVWSITPNVTTLSEGAAVLFSITTGNVIPGTYYWVNNGTSTAADFLDSANTGSFSISGTYASGTGSITRQVRADFTTEGGETLILELRKNSVTGTTLATANTVVINDTSVETYACTPSVLSVDEGNSVNFSIVTQGVPNGTTLYWTNNGTTNASDFTGGQNSGSFTISANAASVLLTLNNDVTTEGSETIILQIRTGSVAGPVQNTAATVTVVDSSRTPAYGISPSSVSVSEGTAITWTATTSNVNVPVTLYWTNSGTTAAADFTQATTSGSVTITGTYASGSGTITLNPITTDPLEGTETAILALRTGSTAGPIVATSATVNIADGSAVYSVSPSTSSIVEGNSVTYTITAYNPPSTTLYWTTSGTTTTTDFSDSAVSGTVTISGTSGTVTRTTVNNAEYEGTETIVFELRTGSTAGPIVATASTVNVTDAAASYSVSPSASSVNEGGTITWTTTANNVPSGTTLYWTNSGTTVAADFTGAANSGSFITSGTSGAFSLTLVNDITTEGSETIIIDIRTGSTAGPIVATSSTVTVNDTSVGGPDTFCALFVSGGGGGVGINGGGGGGRVATASHPTYGKNIMHYVGLGAGGAAGLSCASHYHTSGTSGGSSFICNATQGGGLYCYYGGGAGAAASQAPNSLSVAPPAYGGSGAGGQMAPTISTAAPHFYNSTSTPACHGHNGGQTYSFAPPGAPSAAASGGGGGAGGAGGQGGFTTCTPPVCALPGVGGAGAAGGVFGGCYGGGGGGGAGNWCITSKGPCIAGGSGGGGGGNGNCNAGQGAAGGHANSPAHTGGGGGASGHNAGPSPWETAGNGGSGYVAFRYPAGCACATHSQATAHSNDGTHKIYCHGSGSGPCFCW